MTWSARISTSRSDRSPTVATAWRRIPDGRVVFVRHTLPGELVTVEITEERQGYLRADAVRDPAVVAGSGHTTVPVRRTGPVRWLRLPARRAGGAARAEDGGRA